MTTGGGDSSSKDAEDTLLRAIAAAPDRPVETPPTRVAHFRILGRLGQGGMGVVYRAEDDQLRRTVALKLLPEASGDEEKKQRFLREARSAAAITHPNVAVVHQVGEAEGRIYIAMELVEGESLRARLDRGRLDLATARELALQIARGLWAAHEKGIVHRDLKPENVMITPAGLVKILDFGLAKQEVARRPSSGPTEAALAKTETLVTSDEGRVMGTPEYMSPEQALGEPVDVRSDVFSFGIVLYEMLAGARPFAGASTGAVLVAIARDAAPALRERAPEVDEGTDAVVMRCLAKGPGERFASAGDVVSALSGRMSSQPAAQSRTDVEPITRSGTVRQRRRTGAVATALLAVTVVGGVAWWGAARRTSRLAAAASASVPSSSNAGAPHRGVAITDHPPPKTSVPGAAAAYARALQDYRGASLASAEEELERATKLDPTLAAAHLRASLDRFFLPTKRREHLAMAEQFRSALDDRDQMILKVAEARLAEPRDEGEILVRLRALTQRFPDDAESSWLLGDELADDDAAAQYAEARVALLHTLDLDPECATALRGLGTTYWRNYDGTLNDADEALRYYSRCLEVSPSAGTCLRQRSDVYVDQGECSRFETDARTMTVVEPQGTKSYQFLAMALASENAPREAVEEALHNRASVAMDSDARVGIVHEDSLAMALLSGDLASAEAEARRGVSLVEGAQTESEHDAPTEMLLDVLEERGDGVRAIAEAEGFERRARAWTQDAPWGVRLRLAFMNFARERIDRAALKATLESLHGETTTRVGAHRAHHLWPVGVGLSLSTPEQATELLDAVVDAGNYYPLQPWMGGVFLLAGRPVDAVEPLQAAARSCTVLTIPSEGSNTIRWMRAHVLLGQALEQTSDPAGACAAYAVVLDRWRDAKPRSVTLEKAKERSRTLGCPKR